MRRVLTISGVVLISLLLIFSIFVGLSDKSALADGGTLDKIYYTNNDGVTLPTYHIDTNGTSNILVYDHAGGDGHYIDKVAVDSAQGKLYFTDGYDYKIYKANLDGTGRTQIYDPGVWPDFFTAYKGYIYFTLNDWSDTINLFRIDSNGNNLLQITSLSHQMVQGVALDPVNDDLYYYVYDPSVGTNSLIYRIDNIVTPGSPVSIGTSIPGSLNALEAYNGYVYYADAAGGDLHRRYMDGTGDMLLYSTTGAVHEISVAPNQNTLYFFVSNGSDSPPHHTYYMTLPGVYTASPSVFASFTGINLQNMDIYYEAAPEIQIEGNSTTITCGDTSPISSDDTDFGNIAVSGGSHTHTFTIRNTGSATLTLTDSSPYVTITGHTSDFTLASIPSSSIAAGLTTTFQINFNPTTSGLRSAAISIHNNDSDENPYTFNIQGTGTTSPEMDLFQSTTAIASGGTYDFGRHNYNTDTDVVFTINNTGDGDLHITTPLSLTGTGSGSYSITDQPDATVTPGSSTTFTVRFHPAGGSTYTAAINIANDDATENPYILNLTGEGATPQMYVYDDHVAEGNRIENGETMACGSHEVSSNTDFTMVIEDYSSVYGDLTFTTPITISGTNANQWSIVTQPSVSSLHPGETTTFVIRFTPTSAGSKTAYISIANNDPDDNPYIVQLSGTGTAPEISLWGNGHEISSGDITPSVLDNTDFGSLNVNGGWLELAFSVNNTGSIALHLTGAGPTYITIEDDPDGNFYVATAPDSTIAAGNSATFYIAFDPNTVGLCTATVSIANDDSDENPYTFRIQGTGLGPDINLKQGSTSIPDDTGNYDFGHHTVSSNTDVVFTIENTGSADLHITLDLTVGGGDADQFSVITQPSDTVGPGGNTTFTIRFSPTSYGTKYANMTIVSDDPDDEDHYYFTFQGLGTVAPVISNLNGDTITYDEDSTVRLDEYYNAAVTDDDATGYSGGTFNVVIAGGGTADEDISIREGYGVTLSDGMDFESEVTIGGVVIGSIMTSGQNGAELHIDLNANADNAKLAILIQNITYHNDSQDPSGSRTINFTISDSYDTSAVASVTVNLVPINDPPTLDGDGLNPTFTEGGAAVPLFQYHSASTIEVGQNFTELILTVTNVTDGADEILVLDGSDVALTDDNTVVTAYNGLTVNVSLVGTVATVTITKTGGMSLVVLASLIDDSSFYRNTSDNPTTSNRVVTIISLSDSGGTADGGHDTTDLDIESTVTIIAVNDEPVITNLDGDSVDVIAGGDPENIDEGTDTEVFDPDSSNFDGGCIAFVRSTGTANGYFGVDGTRVLSGGDSVIAGSEQITVDGTYIGDVHGISNGQTGHNLRIDFNANATPALVAILIRNITYAAPSGLGARIFECWIYDGVGGSASVSSFFTINVTPNPPVITNLDGDTTLYSPFVGGVAPLDVDTDALVTDADNTNFSGGNMTVTITSGFTPAEDILSISTNGTVSLSSGTDVGSVVSVGGTSIGVISVSTGDSLVITFNSGATPARVTTLLRALTYANSNHTTPSLTTRVIQVTISDAAPPNDGVSAPVTVTINMGAPEINIIQNGTTIPDGGAFDFGFHLRGVSSYYTFIIQNTGSAPLNLTVPLVFGGPDADQFSIYIQPVSPIASGDTAFFVVRFTPTTEGVKTATLSIVNNDSDENPYDITFTGSCVAPSVSPYVADDVYYLFGPNVQIETDANGVVLHTYVITSSDGMLSFRIPAGTIALDVNGHPLHTLTINTITNPPPPPPGQNVIEPVFEVLPSGASFHPAIIGTLHYSENSIPQGVSEANLHVGCCHRDSGTWDIMNCSIDTLNNVATFMTGSFSYYALMYASAPASINVSNLAINQSRHGNQTEVNISVDAMNNGGSKGDYIIILKVNQATIDSQTVSLNTGAVKTITFTLNDQPPGTYSVEINGLTGNYQIAQPAELTVPTSAPVESIAPQVNDSPTPTATSIITAPQSPNQPVSIWIVIVAAIAGFIFLLIIWQLLRRVLYRY